MQLWGRNLNVHLKVSFLQLTPLPLSSSTRRLMPLPIYPLTEISTVISLATQHAQEEQRSDCINGARKNQRTFRSRVVSHSCVLHESCQEHNALLEAKIYL